MCTMMEVKHKNIYMNHGYICLEDRYVVLPFVRDLLSILYHSGRKGGKEGGRVYSGDSLSLTVQTESDCFCKCSQNMLNSRAHLYILIMKVIDTNKTLILTYVSHIRKGLTSEI